MPRHTHLMRRGSRYYLNVKVPKDLRQHLGKELIRKSLGTSDRREAEKNVRYESCKLDTYFEMEREKLQTPAKDSKEMREEVSTREIHSLVHRFLIELEKDSERWWEEKGRKLDEVELDEVLDTLATDEEVYRGGSRHYREEEGDSTGELSDFLKEVGLQLPETSSSYKKLLSLFRAARLENVQRSIDRVNRRTVQARAPVFQNVFSHSPANQTKPVTLGELLDRYKKALSDTKRTSGTQKTYDLPGRLLCEILGKNTLVESIQLEEVERLLSLLRRAPSNATKKYPGLTLEQAVKAADRDGNKDRLKPKTLENYFNNISAIFNFAVEKSLLAKNPVKDRWLRASFIGDDDETPKAQFSISELNTIFRTPLYTGCVDDEMNYSKAGRNRPRRGRFWVPLLSLFHGLRCNEAAQLYTEDVCEAEGFAYFEIRETRADGSKCDKRLKSKQSRRRVPIHSELIRMGFLDFVAERRRYNEHLRLFPDLPIGASGYFSDPFSKWFSRFKDHAVGKECHATFHSFRHHFRSALGEAGVPIPDVEMLGGWEVLQRSSERRYDKPTLLRLRSRIEQVSFPGLDLTHL